jgi:hypothetical protein
LLLNLVERTTVRASATAIERGLKPIDTKIDPKPDSTSGKKNKKWSKYDAIKFGVVMLTYFLFCLS